MFPVNVQYVTLQKHDMIYSYYSNSFFALTDMSGGTAPGISVQICNLLIRCDSKLIVMMIKHDCNTKRSSCHKSSKRKRQTVILRNYSSQWWNAAYIGPLRLIYSFNRALLINTWISHYLVQGCHFCTDFSPFFFFLLLICNFHGITFGEKIVCLAIEVVSGFDTPQLISRIKKLGLGER